MNEIKPNPEDLDNPYVLQLIRQISLQDDVIAALNELIVDNKTAFIDGYTADSQHDEHSRDGAERAYREWIDG